MKTMIKLFAPMLVLALAACAWVEVNKEASEAIAKISSRRIGAELQGRYPDIALRVYAICEAISADIVANEPEALRYYLTRILGQEIDDPLLAEDIADLVDLVKLKPDIAMSEDQLRLTSMIAQGIMNGIKLAGGHYATTIRDGS